MTPFSPFVFIFGHLHKELLMLFVMSSITQSFQVGDIAMQFAQKFRLAELTEDRIEQSAALLARGFKMHNPIWDGLVKTQEEVYRHIVLKIAECLDWQRELKDQGAIPKQTYYNFICLDGEDKVVCVNIGYDVYHIKTKLSNVKLSQFDVLSEFDQKSKALIDPMDTLPGKAYYSHLAVLDEKYMGTQLIEAFHFQVQKFLKDNGYICLYTRLTNVKSINLFLYYGSVPLQQISLQIGENQYPIMFVRVDLNPRRFQSRLLERKKLKAKL